MEDVDSPLVNIRPVKNVLMVVVTGDRGLCGGYNNFVLKKVREHSASSSASLKRAVVLHSGGPFHPRLWG